MSELQRFLVNSMTALLGMTMVDAGADARTESVRSLAMELLGASRPAAEPTTATSPQEKSATLSLARAATCNTFVIVAACVICGLVVDELFHFNGAESFN